MNAIYTALLPTPAALNEFPMDEALQAGGVLLLLSLGFTPDDFLETTHRVPESVAVLLADCYGVLGSEPDGGRNREFIEAGRGREYGGVGGRGGQAVVAVAIAGARVEDEAASASPAHLVIAAHGKPRPEGAPCFGGVAKTTWHWNRQIGRFVETPGFRLGFPADWKIGLRVCSGEVESDLNELWENLPSGCRLEAVALFPCYMRGINYYGRDDVEPEAVARLLPGVPVFGMFCHGELGPLQSASGYDLDADTPCAQHSMVTVIAFLGR